MGGLIFAEIAGSGISGYALRGKSITDQPIRKKKKKN
jgi:hypothetical protein